MNLDLCSINGPILSLFSEKWLIMQLNFVYWLFYGQNFFELPLPHLQSRGKGDIFGQVLLLSIFTVEKPGPKIYVEVVFFGGTIHF